MTSESLMELCEAGQDCLMRMEYLRAESLLAEAERAAWAARDWDALSRLYMPLQEPAGSAASGAARAASGSICWPAARTTGPTRHRSPANFRRGSCSSRAGDRSRPALAVRELAARQSLYLETFLAAAYPVNAGAAAADRVIAIVPLADAKLPDPSPRPLDALRGLLPAHSIVMSESDLPRGARPGSTDTYAEVMGIWERLHRPFVAAADAQADPLVKIEGYRTAIRVDYACELAHQKLSDVAREMLRQVAFHPGR